MRARGDVSRNINEAGGPVEAGGLEFADRFVTAMMTCCATMASADVVDVFRCDRESAACIGGFCGLTC